jgi:hypothetical protein
MGGSLGVSSREREEFRDEGQRMKVLWFFLSRKNILVTSLLKIPRACLLLSLTAGAPLPPGLRALIGAGVSNLSVLEVRPHLVWAAWLMRGPEPQAPVSHLALFRSGRQGPVTIWSRSFADAFEPIVTPVYGLVPDGYSAFLLHLQYGADAAAAVLLAVDGRDRVFVVGREEANGVDLVPWAGHVTLRKEYSAGDAPECVHWVGAPGVLVPGGCPGAAGK